MALDTEKTIKLIELMNTNTLIKIPPEKPIIKCFEICMDQQTEDFLLTLDVVPYSLDELKEKFCQQYKDEYQDLDSAWNDQWAKINDWSFMVPYQDLDHWMISSIFPGWIELGTSGPKSEKRDAVTESFMDFWDTLQLMNIPPYRDMNDQKGFAEVAEGPAHMGVVPAICKAGAKAKRQDEAAKEAAIARGENPRRVLLNTEITSEQRVLTANNVFEILDCVGDDVAVMNCICNRHKIYNGGSECEHGLPVERCMAFGLTAKHLVANGVARPLTHDEAWDMLEDFERKGCIHTTYHYDNNANNELWVVCNCCTDCCLLYNSWANGYLSKISVKAMAIPKTVDEEKCSGCNLCGKFCPTHATFYDEASDKLVFNSDTCIGCGQCVTQCRFGAREMVDNVRNVFVPSLDKESL